MTITLVKMCSKGLHDVSSAESRRPNGACRECYLEYQRVWARNRQKNLRAELDAAKVERGCACCGYSESAFALQFDHIKPVRGSKKNTGVKNHAQLRRLLADTNIQVLCANCHCIKTRTNGEYRRSEEEAA